MDKPFKKFSFPRNNKKLVINVPCPGYNPKGSEKKEYGRDWKDHQGEHAMRSGSSRDSKDPVKVA